MRKLIDLPPVWLAVFLAFAWLQGSYLSVGPPAGGVMRVFAWLLIVTGVVVILLAARELHRHRTTVVPHQEPDALVTSGVFGISRNPIYLADALILTGCTVLWGSWPSLVLVPVFVSLISRRFVRPEEARLRAAFGARFKAYENTVRRWL